jgi:acyl-CoA synthetase (AMP-forming)/AMP-acid ligase II
VTVDLEGVGCIADLARVQARGRGAAAAATFEGRTTTFGEVDALASRYANALIGAGVGTQERIGYLSKNNEHFLPFLLGACKARATLAPLNFRLAPPEIARLIEDSQAKIVIVGPDVVDLGIAAVASLSVKPRLIALGFDHPGLERHDAWGQSAGQRDPRLAADPDDDVVQLYTSGTTGLPKGVRLTNRNYLTVFSLVNGFPGLRYGVGETVLAAMPFFHVAGVNIALVAMASGARSAIVRDVVPDLILDLIGNEGVNHAFLAPAIILMLMRSPKVGAADLSSMKALSYGASPISEDLLVRARERFRCEFIQFYGMTETTGAATYLSNEAHDPLLGKLRSCGIAWPGVEVKIVDAEGREAPRGAVGEVLVRGDVVMKGYWNQPEETASAIGDGWMRTGDAAYMDEEGYVFVFDRMKDLIVTGGENVYPAEVENALFGHPAIADAAVIGVPDETWGEAVKAIIVAKPGAPRDAADIIAWVRGRIAGYKSPRSVDFIEAIPRNATGKILRRQLREPYWKGATRKVN